MLQNLLPDKKGVSEIIGTVLLLGIAVVLFCVAALLVLSYLHPPVSAHTNLETAMIGNNIIIYHKGGNDLNPDDTLIFDVNGTRVVKNVSQCLQDKNNDGKWNIGEKIIYTPHVNATQIGVTVVSKEANMILVSTTVKTDWPPPITDWPPPMPDLIVERITFVFGGLEVDNPTNLTVNQPVKIRAYIKNQGDKDVPPVSEDPTCRIRIKFKDIYNEEVVEPSPFDNSGNAYIYDGIGMGKSRNRSLDWTPKTSGNHTIKIIVDDQYNITESNENNNEKSVQILVYGLWVQTTKSDFESGVLANVDTNSSSGDVKLALISTSYNPSKHNLYGGTTLISGTVANLTSNDDVNMTFGSSYMQVTYVSAGTGSGTTGNPTPAYPTGLQANDLILLQVTVRDTRTTPTTPTGFTPLYGPDSTDAGRQWIYYRFSDGTESGTITITIGGKVCKMARMYAFRNVATSSFTEYGDFDDQSSNIILAQSVTTTGDKRLAVSFVFVNDDNAVDSFTGETGGDWTEAVAEFTTTAGKYGCIQLQTATMASAGTISGGSYEMNAKAPWGVRAFALVPLQVCEVEFTGASNTDAWSQLTWTLDSAWSTGSVNVLVQLYNYTAGAYPTSGSGYISYTSSATPDTGETKSQSITADPTSFRDGSGNWKMKITGTKSTPASFQFKADWVEFKPTKVYSSGSVASAVFDTGISGANWTKLEWSESLPSGTDITFEVRASDTPFAKDSTTLSWISVGGTSPVTSGLPSGRYLQWRATLTTIDTTKTPVLHDVTVTYI